ncbi:alpha/beta hydrolase [Chitinophaga sp.]|uniref:alpha/beta fold hydrolase n=1 Tax=Chitinophaga sp. TaxID=1869181 RepID=UPI0031DE6477
METILLLHGWPQTSHIWRHVIPALSAQYHILAPDLPGLGNSPFASQYDTAHIAQLIKDYLNEQQVLQCHVVGHDIGGWVAVAFALQFESICLSLTVMDAGIPGLMPLQLFQPDNAGRVWQFYFHAVPDIPEILVLGREKEYLNWYFSHKTFVKGSIDTEVYYEAYKGKDRLAAGFNYYRAFNTSAVQNKTQLRKLKIPVMTVGGEYAVGENMRAVAEALSEAGRTVVIPGCGHYIPEEQPVAVVELLREFWK